MTLDASSAAPRDLGPAVRFPPPLLFVAGFGLAALATRWWPLEVSWLASVGARVAGVALAVIGVTMAVTGVVTFRRAQVSVYPNRPARHLVTHGIYRYTRNPMYIGMTLVYLGGTIVSGWLWALVLLPVVLLALYVTVIRREERHLTERFPHAYAEYRTRVRRWI